MKMQLFGCFKVGIDSFTDRRFGLLLLHRLVEDTTQEKEVSVTEEKEEPLEVENWMVNEAYWGL